MILSSKCIEEVKKLMKKSKFNRDDDYALYADYIKLKLPDKKPSEYYEIMQNHGRYNIYSIKTIERARRMIQAEARKNGDESLMSSKEIERYRKELIEEYKKLNAGGVMCEEC